MKKKESWRDCKGLWQYGACLTWDPLMSYINSIPSSTLPDGFLETPGIAKNGIGGL